MPDIGRRAKQMEIEILHTVDCPNWREAERLVDFALDKIGAEGVPVKHTVIESADGANAVPFAGSPTILIDGVDAFPSAEPTQELACRVYFTGGRPSGVPPLSDLQDVLEERLGLR